MGEAGVIYDAEQQGRTVIVRWNSDHPFYRRFILENVQDKKIVAASDFLIYSLACAELMWFTNDETVELIHNLKSVMSTNMRNLAFVVKNDKTEWVGRSVLEAGA